MIQVILRSDVVGLGKRGDIVEVADGHARNFLLPKGKAMKATDGAVVQAAKMRRSRDLRDASRELPDEEIRRVGKPASASGDLLSDLLLDEF